MSSKYFNSAADDPVDKYAFTGKRQKVFARELGEFLGQANMISDRYDIQASLNLDGDEFYRVRFLSRDGKIKTSVHVGIEKSEIMDKSKLVIDLIEPNKPADNLLYFVDARLIVSNIARRHDIHCSDRVAGHYELEEVKFFSETEEKFRGFMMEVEKAIRLEPSSVGNQARMKPQPRIPMHKGFY